MTPVASPVGETLSADRDRLIHILAVHFDMFRVKAEEAADLFLHDKTLSRRSLDEAERGVEPVAQKPFLYAARYVATGEPWLDEDCVSVDADEIAERIEDDNGVLELVPLYASPARSAGSGVKALEWSNWSSHMNAHSIAGVYTIKHDGDDPEPWTVLFGAKMIACCNAADQAKAAAQADFDQRIRSALYASPAEPLRVTDEMVERAARAIASTAYDGIFFSTRSREQYIEAGWRDHETDARTALTAALQPKGV